MSQISSFRPSPAKRTRTVASSPAALSGSAKLCSTARRVASRANFIGSGWSAWGRVEHRGWLVPHEACVHPPDRDNEEWLGADPYLGAIAAPVVTFVMLLLTTEAVLTFRVVRTRGRSTDPAGA